MQLPKIVTIDENGDATGRALWQPPEFVSMDDVKALLKICAQRGLDISPSVLVKIWLTHSGNCSASWLDINSVSEDEVYRIITSSMQYPSLYL